MVTSNRVSSKAPLVNCATITERPESLLVANDKKHPVHLVGLARGVVTNRRSTGNVIRVISLKCIENAIEIIRHFQS